MTETETAVFGGSDERRSESKGSGHLNKRKEKTSCVDADKLEGDAYDEAGGLTYSESANPLRFTEDSITGPSLKVGASMEEITEAMRYSSGRRGRKRRRVKGGGGCRRTRVDPMVTRSLGEATLLYTKGCLKDAVSLLKEVVVAAPNIPNPYHMLGLVYAAMGDSTKSLNCYMLAAHLRPKDSSLWKLLVTLSAQQGKTGQARYCLRKAITAEPEDTALISLHASLYVGLKDYVKAAELYEKVLAECPNDRHIMTSMCDLYVKCDQPEKSIAILEDFLAPLPYTHDLLPLLRLLTSICIDCCEFEKAVHHIRRARAGLHEPPLDLLIKEGICHINLGESAKAEQALAPLLLPEDATEHADLVVRVGDSNSASGRHELALKYYLMAMPPGEGEAAPSLYAKVAECYRCLNDMGKAALYMYKLLHVSEGDVVCRLRLASLLLDQCKDDEAISLLSRPENSENSMCDKGCGRPWWLDGRIRLMLARIYRSRGDDAGFVGVIFSAVRDSLVMERCRRRRRRRGREASRPRVSKSVLRERAKLLDGEGDGVFRGFKPVACSSDLSKAARARVILRGRETSESESESSEEEEEAVVDDVVVIEKEERGDVVVEVCEALESMGRKDEAMEIISLALRVCLDERLVSMGARMVAHTRPDVGFDFAKCVVEREPQNVEAWNSYYRLVSKIDFRFHRHCRFVHRMRARHRDCVPPIIISGHHLTMISQHQAAAREYLQAYTLLPNSPLVNLCVGTALINVGLGLRVRSRHETVAQGLMFLCNSVRLCGSSQESVYNFGRACHHVGLVSLAAAHYHSVFAMPAHHHPTTKKTAASSCDLHREAAFNLHLII